MRTKQEIGKKNRTSGAAFERKVRGDLESKGWIVDKWSNNVELQEQNSKEVSGKVGGPFGKLIPAKRKWMGANRPLVMGTGFPDFIAFKFNKKGYGGIFGVESKISGTLDKIERKKCRWMLDNYVFHQIIIASKTIVGRKIVVKYEDFEQKYGNSN